MDQGTWDMIMVALVVARGTQGHSEVPTGS